MCVFVLLLACCSKHKGLYVGHKRALYLMIVLYIIGMQKDKGVVRCSSCMLSARPLCSACMVYQDRAGVCVVVGCPHTRLSTHCCFMLAISLS
jgi:hypothetical protein